MTAEHDRQMLQFWVNEARKLCAAASARLRALQQAGVL